MLEQYQRFTRLSTITSDPDNDLAVKRSGGPACVCSSPANKPSDDAHPAVQLGCRGGADGTDDGAGVRHGYDHTSALGDLPDGQRDDADDADEPRAVPVRQQVEREFRPDQGERRNAARSLNSTT